MRCLQTRLTEKSLGSVAVGQQDEEYKLEVHKKKLLPPFRQTALSYCYPSIPDRTSHYLFSTACPKDSPCPTPKCMTASNLSTAIYIL